MGSYSDTVTLSNNNGQTLSIGMHAIVELANGYGWGLNDGGQLGDGQTTQSSPMMAMVGGIRFTEMSTGGDASCGLNYNGTPFCWGDGGNGELGNGTYVLSSTPVAVSGNYTLNQISVGSTHVCGITTSGSALCWGQNSKGELGNASTTTSATPVSPIGSMSFFSITAGNAFTCGITFSGKSTGPTYCWGINADQELGSGPGASYEAGPTLVSGGHSFVQVVAATNSTCALTSTGSAYCWGMGSAGEIGNGNTSTASAPTAVSGGLSFTSLVAGGAHFCGLVTGGQAFCWGYNNDGQLGDNNGSINSLIPVAVYGGYQFKQLSAGISFTCGLLTSGELMCWGSGANNRLSTGSTKNSTVPVATTPQVSFSGIWSNGSQTQNGLAFE